MVRRVVAVLTLLGGLAVAERAYAQAYGQPDRGEPGDEMIQNYLARETAKIEGAFLEGIPTAQAWEKERLRYKQEYFYMLGLWPLPEKTPLKATVTGTYAGDGFVVEMVHYQSRPGLYVTGNLYRPAKVAAGSKLPAVFYVCGHSGMGRNGNKTAYMAHGIWLAKHGYICLTVDTLQLGEIEAVHHGTYNRERWWWHSRGYTSAGVECWNGVRGIDYLISRPDVDAERIAVTGISGGGAATFWIAAADERVRVAVPVSGMSDLTAYVPNRVINGHCDCMFLYNTFRWPWARIAGLIAPRPMLFTNSDDDRIFPMDGNERIINRLERLYSLYGAGDRVDALVSVGGHAYRQDLRQGIFRFINTYMKNDPAYLTDTETDLVTGERGERSYPIPPEKLRVFPTDADLPSDQLNTTIDESFVPLAKVDVPAEEKFDEWKTALMTELRRVSFQDLAGHSEPAKPVGDLVGGKQRLETEPGIVIQVAAADASSAKPTRVLLVVRNAEEATGSPAWLKEIAQPGDRVVLCDPRGVGETRWTRKNPPNYVERSHVLLGRTVDAGRVHDIAATARHLKTMGAAPVYVTGKGAAGVLAAYAALWEPTIAGAVVVEPIITHMESQAPQFLNVLRVCDIPESLGMLAPRPLTIVGTPAAGLERVAAIYKAAGAEKHLTASK